MIWLSTISYRIDLENRLITTDYNDHGHIIAICSVSDFGAIGDGNNDDTLAFKAALNFAESHKGGSIWVDSGEYVITQPLFIPKSVYLIGQWYNPDLEPIMIRKGSVLLCKCGKNKPLDKEFISIGPSAGIIGLTIHYPDQNADDPVQYPATIKSLDTEGGFTSGFATVRNVTIANAYNGLMFGPEWNELHIVENLYMTCINSGIFINMVTDIGRLENINISSDYWCLFDPDIDRGILVKTMKRGCVGIEIQRADWQYCFHVNLSDLHTGILFERMTSREDVTDGSNSQIYDINIKNTFIGLDFSYINTLGVSITKGRINADTEEKSLCARFAGTYMGTLQVSGVDFVSENGSCILTQEYSKGNIVFMDCSFEAKEHAVILNGSCLSAVCNRFATAREVVCINEKSSCVTMNNNNFNGSLLCNTAMSNNIDIGGDPYYKNNYTDVVFPEFIVPKVKNAIFINITDFAVYDGGQEDSTGGVQDALNMAGSKGGGIVYLPGGIYRLYGRINIPSGVELRGVSESGHHSNGLGSVLCTYNGENNEDGEPFITMEPFSGIRGVCVWYPGQSQVEPVKFPWTIRGLGEGVWIVNVNIAGAYRAVDLGTHDCKGHFIKYLTGQAYKCNLWVDNCSDTGYIKNCHFNPHFLARVANSGLTLAEEILPEYFMGVLYLHDIHLEAIKLDGTKNEFVFDIFNYRAKIGLVLGEKNPFDGFIMAAGLDGGAGGIEIKSTGGRELVLMNSNADIVPGETFYLKCHKNTNVVMVNSSFGAFNYTPEHGIVCNGCVLKLLLTHFRASAKNGGIYSRQSNFNLICGVFSHIATIRNKGFSDQDEAAVLDCVNEDGNVEIKNSIFRNFSNIRNSIRHQCINSDYKDIYSKD